MAREAADGGGLREDALRRARIADESDESRVEEEVWHFMEQTVLREAARPSRCVIS